MNQSTEQDKRIGALMTLLDQITDDHRALADLIDQKIEAMRIADVNGLVKLLNGEHAQAAAIAEKEGLRSQLVESIARGYGISSAAARRMKITQVAQRFGGSLANDLTAAADRARYWVTVVVRKNHQARQIARGVVGHMRYVLAAMAGGETTDENYTRVGAGSSGRGMRILDAVG